LSEGGEQIDVGPELCRHCKRPLGLLYDTLDLEHEARCYAKPAEPKPETHAFVGLIGAAFPHAKCGYQWIGVGKFPCGKPASDPVHRGRICGER
jgi:hypothetical protein